MVKIGNLREEKSIKVDRLIDLETQRREERRERTEGQERRRKGGRTIDLELFTKIQIIH